MCKTIRFAASITCLFLILSFHTGCMSEDRRRARGMKRFTGRTDARSIELLKEEIEEASAGRFDYAVQSGLRVYCENLKEKAVPLLAHYAQSSPLYQVRATAYRLILDYASAEDRAKYFKMAMNDDYYRVRSVVVHHLEGVKASHPELLPALLEIAASGKYGDVRCGAFRRMAYLHANEAEKALGYLRSIREDEYDGAPLILCEAFLDFMALRGWHGNKSLEVAMKEGLPQKEIVEFIKSSLKHKRDGVRAAAAEWLWLYLQEDENFVTLARSALTDKSVDVVDVAVRALGMAERAPASVGKGTSRFFIVRWENSAKLDKISDVLDVMFAAAKRRKVSEYAGRWLAGMKRVEGVPYLVKQIETRKKEYDEGKKPYSFLAQELKKLDEIVKANFGRYPDYSLLFCFRGWTVDREDVERYRNIVKEIFEKATIAAYDNYRQWWERNRNREEWAEYLPCFGAP
ncbi:MAG: hypothetical protein ABIH04_08205 [Planctomycetota bacterium]